MIRVATIMAFALALAIGPAAAQTQPLQGEPGAKRPNTQNQGSPGSEKQQQPDGDETTWGQVKTDNESKAEPGRNELTGQPPASAPATTTR